MQKFFLTAKLLTGSNIKVEHFFINKNEAILFFETNLKSFCSKFIVTDGNGLIVAQSRPQTVTEVQNWEDPY